MNVKMSFKVEKEDCQDPSSWANDCRLKGGHAIQRSFGKTRPFYYALHEDDGFYEFWFETTVETVNA
jgi:hypothetical protein